MRSTVSRRTVDLRSTGPFVATTIPDVLVVEPVRHVDSRGFFSETFRDTWFEPLGISFVQDNHSLSAEPFTIRGLHYQEPPHAQDKLVRVIRGSVMDVAVDLRAGSPTRGRHVAVTLSAENGRQLLVPKGCAHGFCTLEADTEVVYKVSDHYHPESDRGLRWDDPALGIAWPVESGAAFVSDRDARQPRFAELGTVFEWSGAVEPEIRL